MDKTRAAYYSTFFDIGGIVGSIAVGYLSDILKVRGIACVLMTVLSIPAVKRSVSVTRFVSIYIYMMLA